MKLISRIFTAILILIYYNSAFSQTDSAQYKAKMQWFSQAKLGIFIHWGIYAVNGVSESWSFYNGRISHEDYLDQAKNFKAENYKPAEWAELIKYSGARYSVITSKHHDGFALWKTKFGDLNAPKSSAANRDVLTPFVKELRANDIKVGIYYSLPDWSYPDYTDFKRDTKRYEIKNDSLRWQKFLKYYQGQLSELSNNYDPDLYWFDGDWEHNADEWQVMKVKTMLSEKNKNVIFNSRLNGHGDYETPEIGLPVYKPHAPYWELCITINDSWGFQFVDTNFKTPQQVIDIFVDCISKGGNLLLDIGPKADGTIPQEEVTVLRELGDWNKRYEKAVFQSIAGIPYEHFYGPTTLSPDSSIIYLFVRDFPKDGKIVMKGISNNIKSITDMASGQKLDYELYSKVYWNPYPGVYYINLPESLKDEYYNVIAIELEGPVKLYTKR